MTEILDSARDALALAGFDVTETRDLPHGWQMRCAGGEMVCVYNTGKVVAQGRNTAAVRALFDAKPLPKRPAADKPRAVAAEMERLGESEESRRSPEWSDTWAPGDIPF